MTSNMFTSKRISKTATITLNGSLEKVFALFGPIKEMDWAAGWNPQIIYSTTSTVEEHMVLKTPSHHGHNESEYIWIVSKFLPAQALIEYTVHTSERVWWITIQCRADLPDKTTKAEITYTFSGLTEIGNAINEKALRSMFIQDLKDWEAAINYYLETGNKLGHH